MEEYSELELYDRAVYAYLASISPAIIYSTTQTAVRNITRREKFADKKPWNFVSYYRNPSFEIDFSRMNNPATVTGDFVRLRGYSDFDREARYVQNIPVNLTYNVDIWASKAVEVNNMAISLISKIYMQDQVLEVPINPDGENGRFHILDVSWTDNSDLERETEIGKIYRHTITFTIDARITLVRDVKTTKFCGCIPVNIYEDYEGDLSDED